VLGVATVAFASTNIDDIVVLAIFFSNPAYQAGNVVAGQYLGIAVLVVVSLLIAAGANVIPGNWTRWLGVLPIAIGLKWLLALIRSEVSEEGSVAGQTKGGSGSFLAVALVTIANGGDNLGVYSPLFAGSNAREIAGILGTFGLLTGVWCFAGFLLTHNPLLQERAVHVGRVVAPLVLIAIGVGILLQV